METKNHKKASFTGIGLIFSGAIGAGLGIILNNLAIGAGIGAGLGIVAGAFIEKYKNKAAE